MVGPVPSAMAAETGAAFDAIPLAKDGLRGTFTICLTALSLAPNRHIINDISRYGSSVGAIISLVPSKKNANLLNK